MGNWSNKKTNANGIKNNKKPHAMVFIATSKLILWYLKPQGFPC